MDACADESQSRMRLWWQSKWGATLVGFGSQHAGRGISLEPTWAGA
jgi:hypothetical protein